MNSWFCRRAFVFGVLIAALSTLVFSGTASARATVGTFYSQETFTFSDVSICTGLTGTTTNTVTDAGRFVENADGTFHFSGATTHDYRAVWPHGSSRSTIRPATSRATARDLNGNGQPDPGEFTATVDQFRVTCP